MMGQWSLMGGFIKAGEKYRGGRLTRAYRLYRH